MSLEKMPSKEKKSRYREWRERRTMGEEISASDVKKVIELNRILRSDGKKLGITQVAIEIVPRKYSLMASASQAGYRIKGDGMLTMPSSIEFDYRAVDELNKEELRSIAWHEFGHYIFAHYFPKIDNAYMKDYRNYFVVETFADEFAYQRFGDVFIEAQEKLIKFANDKKDRKLMNERLSDLKKMARYRKRYSKPFWMKIAKDLGVKVSLDSKDRQIVGINPNKSVLKGLYSEE
jgi:hypothetical protein